MSNKIDKNLRREVNKMYTMEEASKMLGVHPNTLRRWEKQGKITTSRTTGGHRRFSIEALSAIKSDV